MKTPLTDNIDEQIKLVQQLERDFWTLFARLIVPWKHDPLSFSTESLDVMERRESEFQQMFKQPEIMKEGG